MFQLLPVGLALRDRGHDVRWALPRSLSMYLRRHGMPADPLGSGKELGLLDDRRTITTRCDGWVSLRRFMDGYIGAHLADDVDRIETTIRAWAPDIVVTTSFAPAARIAAHRQRCASLTLSAHPSVLARTPSAPGYAASFRRTCGQLAGLGPEQLHSPLVTELAWGVGQHTVLIHDPLVLAGLRQEVSPDVAARFNSAVGFPYWDDGLSNVQEGLAARDWLDRTDHPTVIVTLGSFLGAGRHDVWRELLQALAARRLRAMFLGPRRQLHEALRDVQGDFFVAGFVPLSQVVPGAAVVVHHGGVGTTFAGLRAGVPAVVVPLAFDQPFNARLVESTGVGAAVIDGARTYGDALDIALREATKERAAELARGLIPSAEALRRAVARIEGRLETTASSS